MILLTGASEGLGLALATRFKQQNRSFLAIGRRPLMSIEGAPFPPERYLQLDLTAPDAVFVLLRALNTLNVQSLELVIPNAGGGYYGPPEAQPEEDIESLVDLNFTAPVRLTQALAGRLEKAHGKVVFIGSLAASLPCPHYATYAATKRALEGFARNLRVEARGRYRVQVIHPGAMRTRFHEKLGIAPKELGWEKFPDVEGVASAVIRTMERRKWNVILGLRNRMAFRMARMFPRTFDRVYARRFT